MEKKSNLPTVFQLHKNNDFIKPLISVPRERLKYDNF